MNNETDSSLVLEMEPKEGSAVQVITEELIEHYRWVKNMSHEKELVIDLKGHFHNIAPKKMIELPIH